MSQPIRVLIIEDSEDDAELLLRELRAGGYRPTAHRVWTADAMRAALEGESWDLIISDHAMPSFSSLAALDVAKSCGVQVPFIIVSGAILDETAVEAMRAGARDYLRKGNLARLVPAITRELKEAEERHQRRTAEEALTIERLRLELAAQLYDEINHRAKNNLMLLAGVLEMQAAAQPPDSIAVKVLRDAVTRVGALSAVHEQLYQASAGVVELRDLIDRIGRMGLQALSATSVRFSVMGDACTVSSKQGSTLAIVANELITNALKYGAAGADGVREVSVEIARRDGTLELRVWNSGNPVPAGFDPATGSGLGLRVTLAVVESHAGGHLSVTAHQSGTLARVVLPLAHSADDGSLAPATSVQQLAVPGPA